MLKDSEREAEKKQAEAVQLEQKMDEMEKAMMEMEQRYVLSMFLCVRMIFLFKLTFFLLGRLCITDYRTRSDSANKVTSQTKI